tara:strand:- start:768 stop:1085 length:318 start_codon:yes stop_codon:yes gene_type:complete
MMTTNFATIVFILVAAMNYIKIFVFVQLAKNIIKKLINKKTMKVKVKILNTDGLDDKTKKILDKECYFIKEYIENETLFLEIKSIDNETVRIFPERIKLIKTLLK